MDERIMEKNEYQCFVLDPETADCFEGLYVGKQGELANKLAIGAIRNNSSDPEPCGLLVVTPAEQEIQIEWLYVDKEASDRKYIARKLMSALLLAAWSAGFTDLSVLLTDNKDPLLPLYREYGFLFDDMSEYGEIRVTLSDFTFKPAENDQVISLHDLLPSELAAFRKNLEEEKVPCPIPFPIQKNDYLRESSALIHNGKIHALLLLREEDNGLVRRLTIPWLYADAKGKTILGILYDHVAYLLKESYPPNIEVRFCNANPGVKRMAEKLFRKITFIPYLAGYARIGTLRGV